MADLDSSTRTVASVGAVLGVLATALAFGALWRTQTLAVVSAATVAAVEQSNEQAHSGTAAAEQRIQALEAKLAELEAKVAAPAAPVAEAEPAKKGR